MHGLQNRIGRGPSDLRFEFLLFFERRSYLIIVLLTDPTDAPPGQGESWQSRPNHSRHENRNLKMSKSFSSQTRHRVGMGFAGIRPTTPQGARSEGLHSLLSALLLHLKLRNNFWTRTPPFSPWSCTELITDWGRTPQIPGPVLLPSGHSHHTWGPWDSSPTQTCGINFVPQEPIHPSVHSSVHPSIRSLICPPIHPSVYPPIHPSAQGGLWTNLSALPDSNALESQPPLCSAQTQFNLIKRMS